MYPENIVKECVDRRIYHKHIKKCYKLIKVYPHFATYADEYGKIECFALDEVRPEPDYMALERERMRKVVREYNEQRRKANGKKSNGFNNRKPYKSDENAK